MSKQTKNNLIAICSTSQGVGKTWFSGILSQTLSNLQKKVLFFDADTGIENIAYQLGLKSSDLYFKMLKNNITLNNAVQNYTKGHFDIIYSNPAQNDLSTQPIGRSQILALDLKNFALNYDYVVIDCSGNNSKLKNIFINASSSVILIIEPSVKSSTNAYRQLEHIKKIAPNAQIFIVTNRALSHNEGEQIFKTLQEADNQFIKANPKFLGSIKQDGRIRDCVKNKTTLFERYPVCECIAEIQNIALNFLKEDTP